MTIKISSLLISVFFGFFSASGTLLGMNLYEDKHKTEKAEESLYAATLLKDNSAIADAVLKKQTSDMLVSEEITSVSRLCDMIPASEFGTVQGVISVPARNIRCSLVYGVTEKALYSNACIHSKSYQNSLVVLAHNYRGGSMFHNLLNAQVGDVVEIEFKDQEKQNYQIAKMKSVSESEYESMQEDIFSSEYQLILVTCSSGLSSSGRCIAFCTQI